MTPRPIFIVGAMGSGTTLLRLVLDAHENIAIPQETGFMRVYDAHRYTPFKASGKGWMKRLGWSDDERDELLGEHFDRIFTRYAEQHGKRRWGDKTPIHTWHIDDMARLFPEAQFIGVIRHPGASVASNMSRFRLKLSRCWTHWARYTGEIVRQAARHGDRFAVLRYEDLTLDPEPVLRELLEWLGEPWSDAVVAHHEVHGARGGRAKVEGRSRADDPIDVSRVDKWLRTMRPEHREWLGRRAPRRSAFFGYEFDEPAPVAPLSDSGGLVVRGIELDARIDRFPELDLRRQRKLPLYDSFYDPRHLMILRREQFDRLTQRRGLRGLGVKVVRRMPKGARPWLKQAVRRARGAAGLKRRPKRVQRRRWWQRRR